jgi:hypothetical protein
MKARKLLLAIVGVAMVSGVLAGGASARILSANFEDFFQSFRSVTLNGAFGDIRCEVAFEEFMHSRSMVKTTGGLVGYIETADLGPCELGTATILRETLPWHIRYGSYTGTLPNITSIRVNIVGFSIRAREPFATCLARSTATSPAIITMERNVATRTLGNAILSGSVPTSCGVTGTFTSTADPVTGITGRLITVTLI